MGNIIVLDENTANKIAAGEVIERPSSIVKELIENSIDAKASKITVEIRNGGITYIKITDNGCGIAQDDIELAFERHATSKIKSALDLDDIKTMGFRGEALSSIAAVADIELISRPQDSSLANTIKIRGGTLLNSSKKGGPLGTTFIIKDLFFNTPARFKFLKKDSTEASHISDIVTRLALVNKNISFSMTNNFSSVIQTPGNGDLKSTIYSIYGKDITQEIKEVKYEDDKINISGYAGEPNTSRSTRNNQSIFVNGRYIKDKTISSAIDQAYKTLIMKNKHPFIVLDIKVNPLLVDVNVHPNKTQIRFSNEQDIFRAVYYSIKNAFFNSENNFDVKPEKNLKKYFKPNNDSIENVQKEINSRNTLNNIKDTQNKIFNSCIGNNKLTNTNINSDDKVLEDCSYNKKTYVDGDCKQLETNIKDKEQKSVLYNNIPENTYEQNKNIDIKIDLNKTIISNIDARDNIPNIKSVESVESIDSIDFIDSIDTIDINSDEIKKPIIVETKLEVNNKVDTNNYNLNQKKNVEKKHDIFSTYNITGQIFSTYIVLSDSNKMLLIDQHAAHERVKYEMLRERYKKKNNMSQMLLVPEVINLSNNEIIIIEDKKDLLFELGFEVEKFGDNSIIVRSIPYLQETLNSKELFLDVLDKLSNTMNKDTELIVDEAIYEIACKAAIKANKKLDIIEINSLLHQLESLENPYTCPHGRPVYVSMDKQDIEKIFKRRL